MSAAAIGNPQQGQRAFQHVWSDGSAWKLRKRAVEKPWGRTGVPSVFGIAPDQRVGEIWFEHPVAEDLPLLVKYIFTREKLSIQVHPNDAQARERGFPRGKNECWFILDAERGATLGLGLRRRISPAELRAAALDGSIEHLLDWRPVARGDFFYVPAGTIHAIGAGISLVEFQQKADVTYRLYDYGRPRELHLEQGIAVATPKPYFGGASRPGRGLADTVLHDGPEFCLVRASSIKTVPAALHDRIRWVLPLEGSVSSHDVRASPGECLLLEAGAPMSFDDGAVALIGGEGSL